ncbi:ABC transporter permease [Patescibacteria group bacterium]|nr:ABC transporter permease [Patescibacteria group bacterium]
MNQFSTLKMALTALWINKVRSILTLLGIVIGISAVVVIIASGEGVQNFVLNQIQSFGTNVMTVMPGGSDDDRMGPPAAVMGVTVTTLTMDDMYAIGDPRNVPDVLDVGAASAATQVVIPGIEDDIFVALYGVSPSYFSISNMDLVEGDAFTEDDVKEISTVAVIGDTVKTKLFGDEDAVGQKIKLGNHRYRIVGVLEGGTTFGIDMGKMVYVPVTTAQKLLLGVDYVSEIMIRVTSEDRIEAARADVQNLLRERHRITDSKNDDFTIRTIKDALATIQMVMGALTLFLAAIAAISLLVGGIGIMNIMLVSVTERTREIGLRKAIGAKRKDILIQFLLEAVLLTGIGGLVGFIFGISGAALTAVIGNWSFHISWQAIVLPMLMTAFFGVVFGMYPAVRASRLDPIAALRYE